MKQNPFSNIIQIQSRAEWQFYTLDKEKSNGFLLFQEISYSSVDGRFTCSFRYLNFNTQDYDNRIYTYEKDVRYAFSIPAFYGKGNRFYLVLRYQISDGMLCRFKYSQTNYFGICFGCSWCLAAHNVAGNANWASGGKYQNL